MPQLTLDTLVKKTSRLLAIPRVVGEIMRLLDDPNSTQAQLAKLLAQDPALVAILLRLANSPAFATARTVDSVEHAVMLLGRENLRRLVIAGAVTQASSRLPAQQLLPLELFWRHSSYCAALARLLAEEKSPALASTVFLGGLLHDLGLLILFTEEPEAAHKAFLSSLSEPATFSPQDAERSELGFDHAQAGGALAEHWGLPESLCACLRYHHAPLEAPDDLQLPVDFVHVANTLAHLAELDSRDLRDAPPIEPRVLERLGVDSEVLMALVDKAQHQVLSVEALRGSGPAD